MLLSKKGQFNNNFLVQFVEKPVALLLIILACIVFFAFNRYLLFESLYIFLDIGSDSYNKAYPYFVYISDYIRGEGVPLWSFAHGMGQNIFPGEINNPFNLILYLLGRDYLAYGIAYVEVIKIIIAGIIFYYYLKLLSISSYTRLVGSILFAFSGYMILGSGWYGHSTFIVFGIFFLFSFEKLFKENVWYYVPISVALITSRSAFYLYVLVAFIAVYSIFRILDEENWNFKKIGFFYLKLTGAGFLGVTLVAPFITNDLIRMMQSPRVGGDASYSSLLKSTPVFSFGNYLHNITTALRFFSNDIFGTGSDYKGWYNYLEAPAFYCGLSTLLLFPQVFFFSKKRKRIIYLLFLSIWTLILLFPFFRYGFYLFTGDYYKGGLSFIIPFVLLFFSLHALDHIDKTRKINSILLLVSLGVFLTILYFPFFPENKNPVNGGIRIIITGLLICYSLILLLYGNVQNKNIVRISLVIIVCFEAYMFSNITCSSRIALTTEQYRQNIGYNDGTTDVVRHIKTKDKDFFRIIKNYSSGLAIHKSINDAQIQGYYGTSSYHQFNQKYYIRFLNETGIISEDREAMTRWAPGLASRPLLQTISSVKYYFSKKDYSSFYKNTYRPYDKFNDIIVLKNNYFLPLGVTYDKYIPYDQFKKLSDFQKEMIFLKAFVCEEDDYLYNDFVPFNIESLEKEYPIMEYSSDVNKLKQESLVITEHNQNTITGHIEVKKNKMLFFSIPYDTGWTITIDGVRKKPDLINIGFMGIFITEGIHQIDLTYKPPFLYAGISILIFAVLVYFFLVFFTIRLKRTAAQVAKP